jgi:2-polyprenyl-3-methyl-5-hydroxy-6-metoxy-1,4-benzoquinol methylase
MCWPGWMTGVRWLMSIIVVHDALDARARQSLGSSGEAVYRMVAGTLRARGVRGGTLVDVGCGRGALWQLLHERFETYCGLDAVRYEGFPLTGDFRPADLDRDQWPIDDGTADVVVAAETIEHLENPWAFMRALVRVAKPGGWILVTTPNQLSCLSLITLLVKRRFGAFQDSHYPAHRTALLESDLTRLAGESGLDHVSLVYSESGRLPLTPWHYPRTISRMFPRALSDNLMVIGRKPHA